ncbi:MAG: hypothetical protein R3B95_21680 [Nitrospirales bacterium]|nr:hypothetical protein [Nitrospirales bacterium]
MDKQLLLIIDRVAKALAIQAIQIRAMQSILMDQGVRHEDLAELQDLNRKNYLEQDVKFFRQHLLGQFSSQKRTQEEERDLLDKWWNHSQEPRQPPEGSEGPDPSTSDQGT